MPIQLTPRLWINFVYHILNREPSLITTIDLYCWIKNYIKTFNTLPWAQDTTTNVSPTKRSTDNSFHNPTFYTHFDASKLKIVHKAIPQCTPNKLKLISKIFHSKQYYRHKLQANLLSIFSDKYPIKLDQNTVKLAPPHILFYKTDITYPDVIRILTSNILGVIGTRSPTIYTLQQGTALLTQLLTKPANLHFVSGRARGCDHLAAYVSELFNRPIINIIAQIDNKTTPYNNEILVSEYLSPRHGRTFKLRLILRNRIISLLSQKLLVLQSPIRSGTLITAAFTMLLNRVIYVLSPELPNHDYLGAIVLKKHYKHCLYIKPV